MSEMFGFVQPDAKLLNEEERNRYRSVYCGLCHTIAKRSGQPARLSLTYDLTFLLLFLNSLYESDEISEEKRCLIHPLKTISITKSILCEYTADISVILAYHKSMDDWKDDHNLIKRTYAAIEGKAYQKAASNWSIKAQIISDSLHRLERIESEKQNDPDAAANCFGDLLGTLFLYKKDHWSHDLFALGNALGRFIYFADAVVDLENDRKKGRYNPLAFSAPREDYTPFLTGILGEATEIFEFLPLIRDVNILRNIFYSGIWTKYDQIMSGQKVSAAQIEGNL